jgi:hypothetical protein
MQEKSNPYENEMKATEVIKTIEEANRARDFLNEQYLREEALDRHRTVYANALQKLQSMGIEYDVK